MRTSNLLIAALLAGAMSMPMAMAATPDAGAAGGSGAGGTSAAASGAGGTTAAKNGGGGATEAKPGPSETAGATAANGAGETGGGAAATEGQAAQLPSQRITNAVANGTGAALTISPSGVREVQQQLNRLGYAAGSVNGTWDRPTATAMVEFQKAHGLEPTGNLNISSIAALGLWPRLIGNPLGGMGAVSQNSGIPPARGQGGFNGSMGMNGGYGGGMGMNHYGNGGGMAAGLPSQRITNEFPGGGGGGNPGAGGNSGGGGGAGGGAGGAGAGSAVR